MQSVARVNGWPAASGKYFTTRAPALAFISEAHPHFGIVSLAAYLGMRKAHRLALLGKAEIRGGGGQQYYLVSKTAKDLAGCKGQSLATNHADDPRFVENVIAAGAFKLGEFELDKTRRPLQTVKKVIRDEAACALIDDAQMAELAQMAGGDALKPVWFSARLPPMVVVAFPQAPKAQAKAFAANLTRVCDGEGRASCDAAGIDALEPVKASALADLTAKYGK
jgi:hypothetical protein